MDTRAGLEWRQKQMVHRIFGQFCRSSPQRRWREAVQAVENMPPQQRIYQPLYNDPTIIQPYDANAPGFTHHRFWRYNARRIIKPPAVRDLNTIRCPAHEPNRAAEAGDRVNEVAFGALKAGLQFWRVLSHGGMGVATLFGVQQQHDPEKYFPAVVKIAQPGQEHTLQREKAALRKLNNRHIIGAPKLAELRNVGVGTIVSPDDVNNMRATAEPRNPPVQSWVNEVDNRNRVLVLDYIGGGTLSHWIAVARQEHENHLPPATTDYHSYFGDRTLWCLLACLAEACVEMARHNMVHFDIDPTNVLVDLNEDPVTGIAGAGPNPSIYGSGEGVPRFVLADFGVATVCDRQWFLNKESVWNARKHGKSGYRPPEQWAEEWDAIEENPHWLRNDPRYRVAGKFGEKTNVWQAAMAVLCCITGREGESPPFCAGAVANGFPALDATYGYVLDQPVYRNIDSRLRYVLQKCLAHYPEDRLSAQVLLDICQNAIANTPNPDLRARMLFTDANKPIVPSPPRAYDGMLAVTPPPPGGDQQALQAANQALAAAHNNDPHHSEAHNQALHP